EPVAEPAAEPAPAESVVLAAAIAPEVVIEESDAWYDDLSFGIFADAYYMVDWNMPADPQAWSAAPHRAYDDGQGFGLAFAGADLVYGGEKVGGTISLRYGAGGAALIGGRAPELSVLWQGFVTWSPTDALSFDLG